MGLASTAAKLLASLDLDTKPFERGAARVGQSIGKMESQATRIGRTIGTGLNTAAKNIARIGVVAAGAATTLISYSIRAASDLDESLSKSRVVFGQFAGEIETWAEGAAAAFGQTKQQALEAAGTYGNLFQAFGLGQKPAAEMSQTLVELAADLASFNNTSVEDALLALRSGLSGETEPLKRYGIAISDARLRTALMEQGVTDLEGTLTPLQKAQGAYALILKDSALAQGDFERTSGGLANQQRILKANLDNTAATIGTALLPAVTKVVTKFNALVTSNQGGIKAFAAQLPAVFDSLIEVAENIPWQQIGDSFKLMGFGAKTLLTAFTSLPPWVQTAVLTGWGLNKLTGGALAKIGMELLLPKGGLFSRGATPATPMFTKEIGLGGGGGGPGGVTPVGGAGKGLSALSRVFLAAEAIGLVIAVNEVRDQVATAALNQAKDIHDTLNESLPGATFKEMQIKLAGINKGIADIKGLGNIPEAIFHDTLVELEQQQREVLAAIYKQGNLPKGTTDKEANRYAKQRADAEANRIAVVNSGEKIKEAVDRGTKAERAEARRDARDDRRDHAKAAKLYVDTREEIEANRIKAAADAQKAAIHQAATKQTISQTKVALISAEQNSRSAIVSGAHSDRNAIVSAIRALNLSVVVNTAVNVATSYTSNGTVTSTHDSFVAKANRATAT